MKLYNLIERVLIIMNLMVSTSSLMKVGAVVHFCMLSCTIAGVKFIWKSHNRFWHKHKALRTKSNGCSSRKCSKQQTKDIIFIIPTLEGQWTRLCNSCKIMECLHQVLFFSRLYNFMIKFYPSQVFPILAILYVRCIF